MTELFAPKYTEKARLEILDRGEKSLAFFTRSILGFNLWSPERGRSLWRDDLQGDLCAFLEGRPPYKPWNRAGVSAWRGMGKSTITTQAYPLQRTLYARDPRVKEGEGTDLAVKLVGNSTDNVKNNHFVPMVNLFRYSHMADYLGWLFQHRIPSGFDGWTTEQLSWVRADPKALASISYWGVESKFEGWHGQLVIPDDLEGADAMRSNVSSDLAYATFQKCIPLLADPAYGQILVVGTPHGPRPFIHRMRERQDFTFWWRELLDEKGETRDPERYPEPVIAALRLDPVTFNQQYMLRRDSGVDTPFNLDAYTRAEWRWHPTAPRILCYQGFADQPADERDSYELRPPVFRERTVDLQEMAFFLHCDPQHKTKEERRTAYSKAEHALAVVGVAPDLHVFLVESWAGDCDMEHYCRRMLQMYCRYAVQTITYESIGAQIWLPQFVDQMERYDPQFRHPETFGSIMPRILLPKMTARMVEGEKLNAAKELIYRERLAPWISSGIFHGPAGSRGEKFRWQLENVWNPDAPKDLLDAVSQGPSPDPKVPGRIVWRAPLGKLHERELILRRKQAERILDPRTGYRSPWAHTKTTPTHLLGVN